VLDLADYHRSLGDLLVGLGKQTDAEPHYRKAIEGLGKLAARFPKASPLRRDLGHCHTALASLLRGLGKGAEAEAQHRQALTVRQNLLVLCDRHGTPLSLP